jgi:hypothetical protein
MKWKKNIVAHYLIPNIERALGSVWMIKESERKERVRKDHMRKEKE